MATRTTQVHERCCDRCTKRVPKGKPRFVIDADGVKPVSESQGGPTVIDFCTPCEKSATKWWTRPGKEDA